MEKQKKCVVCNKPAKYKYCSEDCREFASRLVNELQDKQLEILFYQNHKQRMNGLVSKKS